MVQLQDAGHFHRGGLFALIKHEGIIPKKNTTPTDKQIDSLIVGWVFT